MTYVGNKGQNQIRQPDINQIPWDVQRANAALPTAQQAATNYLRPYKGYSAINYRLSDADATYNALQLFISKRRGDLNFTLNYTYSSVYDNASSNTENPEDYLNKDYSWGPSTNNRPHIFVGTWTYRLPFFRKEKSLLSAIAGGWVLSGITRFQSGAPLSITGTTSTGGRRADLVDGVDPYVKESERYTLVPGSILWLNPAAFTVAPEDRRGNTTRGQFIAPALQVWDISIRKQLPMKGSIKAQFQVDLFNAFNAVNWRAPGTNLTSAGFGSIAAVAPPRNIQVGFRVNF